MRHVEIVSYHTFMTWQIGEFIIIIMNNFELFFTRYITIRSLVYYNQQNSNNYNHYTASTYDTIISIKVFKEKL